MLHAWYILEINLQQLEGSTAVLATSWEKLIHSKAPFQHVWTSSAPASGQQFLYPISHYPPGKLQAASCFIPDLLLASSRRAEKHKPGKSVITEPKGSRNSHFTCEYTPSGKCTQDPHVLHYKHQYWQSWCHLHCSFWSVCPSDGLLL